MLFIAGSSAKGDATAAGSSTAVGKSWNGHSGTKGSLGTSADISNCRTRLISHKLKALPDGSCSLGWVTYLDKPGSHLRKEEVLQSLKELFQRRDLQCKEVFYSGHGTEYSGDWCFENAQGEICEFITFEELMLLWEAHSCDGDTLTLVSDCCHSGAWVNKGQQRMYKASVYAACRDNELANEDELGAFFLADFVNACVNDADVKELFKKTYTAKSGKKQHPQGWLPLSGGRLGL